MPLTVVPKGQVKAERARRKVQQALGASKFEPEQTSPHLSLAPPSEPVPASPDDALQSKLAAAIHSRRRCFAG